MSDRNSYDLDPYYLNQRRIAQLVGVGEMGMTLRAVPWEVDEKTRALAIAAGYKSLLLRWLAAARPPAFEFLAASDGLCAGSLFTVLGGFFCRDVRVMHARRNAEASVYAKYEAIRHDVDKLTLRFRLSQEHLLPGSGGDLLRGRVRDLFIVGVIHEVLSAEVVAIPIFIGRRQTPGPLPMWVGATQCEIPPERIDSFERSGAEPHPGRAELEALRGVPEVSVKRAFAEIVGEEDVPKDWGGEPSDLFTSLVRLEGKRVPAAFVFKGPAQFRPMTMVQLGKNGDQLVRLAGEPADLLVVQHCHSVTPAVRAMLRALCNQVGPRRRCAIIDGYDTLRILRAYAKCGFEPSRSARGHYRRGGRERRHG